MSEIGVRRSKQRISLYGLVMTYGHSVVNLVGRVKEEMKIPNAETADEAIKAEVTGNIHNN